ncbi:MAG: DUF3370 family protein [Aphanothece sp. CMT-3BRIN-NPC111]|nr:DUF3370 family protein [Aphanothece sp. CMT-3BRIN-NPC111]
MTAFKLWRNTSVLGVFLWSLLVPNAFAFSDIQNHWAQECIKQLSERKLVTGYPDGSFRPQATVTRAEAAVLMLNAFPDAPIKRQQTFFKDVPSNHWAYRAISLAYQKGFFSGYPGGFFQPNQLIPRVQTIGVLAGAKNLSTASSPAETLRVYFSDAAQVPNYAKNAIASAAINSLVVNYPNIKQLQPNQSTTRGDMAALMCRALNIYAIAPEYIAGVEVQPMEMRPLPGQLDEVPTFNSNSPELVTTEGILLSTFPPTEKQVPQAHLNFAFEGRFNIFTHHIARAETPAQSRTLYQGIIIHNPTDKPVTIKVLQAASYLSNPEAPFIPLPDMQDNGDGRVYSGPGSRTMSDVLRGIRQNQFPEQLVIQPGETQLLENLPIPVIAPSSNGRSTLIRLSSDGKVYVANLAMNARPNGNGAYRAPTLAEWEQLLNTAGLAQKRDPVPTPLDPLTEPTVFSRVAGVSQGAQWQAQLTDRASAEVLTVPKPGQAFSYALGTLHLITLTTGQIQSAEMLVRYPDTAYFAHSNYGVEYNLTLPLHNPSDRMQTVTISLQTPLKDEGGNNRLLFLKPQVDQVFFRGTVRVRYTDDGGTPQTRYVHLVQRRGQRGEALVTLKMSPSERRRVQVDFIYPPDSTPPQVLTVKTAG